MSLSQQQVEHFRRDGYCAPLPVLSPGEADALRRALEQAERDHPQHIHAEHRNNAHIAFPFLADLALDPRIVDCAATLVGEAALDADAEIACRMAKAQATETLLYAGDRAVQFHGGFGFTYECDAQLYLRRALWCQHQFGDERHHRQLLAPALLDAETAA